MGISLGSRVKISLRDLLRQRKAFLLDRWFELILNEYEGETKSFLRKQQDRFANPVAYALRAAAEAILQALIEDRDVDRAPLAYALKIKAVQENDPLRGIAFVNSLKEVVRKDLADSIPETELTDFYVRIDRISSIARDLFVGDRAKIAELSAIKTSRPGVSAGRNKLEGDKHQRLQKSGCSK